MRSMVQYLGFITMFPSFFPLAGEFSAKLEASRAQLLLELCPLEWRLSGFNALLLKMGKEGVSSLPGLS